MHILCVGGGSLGPVTPLLATVRALQKQDRSIRVSWIGTPNGPERGLIEEAGLSFYPLAVAKWPRYPSSAWLRLPWDVWKARQEARRLIEKLKPQAVVSVGGFTATPIIRLASRQGILCFIHQLDYEPGLSNRLVAKQCVSVTTSFEYLKRPFGEKVFDRPIATPVRFSIKDLPTKNEAARAFGLDPKKPIIFTHGGGQGARDINLWLERRRDDLLKFTQIIHLTGLGKEGDIKTVVPGYVQAPLFQEEDMLRAHAAADIEIGRGGIGTLSEIAALKKAALIIPIPDSHQEANARAFEERGAALVFQQSTPTFEEDIRSTLKLLIGDMDERKDMGERAHAFFPTDQGEALAKVILGKLKNAPRLHR